MERARMLCIFCLQEKPARTGVGEHPIPLAVGGSWTIDRVCEDCDSKFGHTHDARLSKVTKVADRREALNLAGNSGTIPNALRKSLSRPVPVADAPYHRMMVKQATDGTFKTETIPNIEFIITIEDGQCFAALKPDTFVIGMMPENEARDLIRRRLKNALEARGVSLTDDIIATAADKMFDEIEVFETPITVNVTREIVTWGFEASLLKAAYEAAWYWLGDDWLSDPEAERMRRHLFGDESATIKGRVQEGAIRKVNVEPTARENAHVLYLFNREGALAVEVQLFDLCSLGVVVTATPEKYKLPPTSAIIMDAVKGSYRETPSTDLF